MCSRRICRPATREATAQQAVIAAETLAIDVERHLHNWEVDQLMDLVDNEVEEMAKLPTVWSRAPSRLQVESEERGAVKRDCGAGRL